MESLDEDVKKILDKYPVFESAERDKLRCSITGHELPARAELLSSYTATPKFIRAFKIHEIMDEYGEYFDDLGGDKYGCKITKKIVAKDPEDLKRHIEGKKFKAALEKAEVDEEHETSEGESDIDEDMDETEGFPNSKEDNAFLEEDDNDDLEDEYPEFANAKGETVSEDDNYDFSVMDTEKDNDANNRKRKAEGTTKHRKKKRR